MSYIKYPTEYIRELIQKDYNNEEKLREYKQTKDINLRNEIVEQNLLLVLKIASEYTFSTKIALGDLIAVGTIALIEAVENFEDNGNKFSTFATPCIINAISKEVNSWYGEGREYYGLAIKIYRHIAISIFGECPEIFKEDTIDYILDIMLEKELIRPGTIPTVKLMLLSKGPVDEKEVENVPYDDKEDFNRVGFIRDYKDRFYKNLTDRQKEIMEYSCGFKDGHPYTQKELAEIFGVSYQAIQQQEKTATTKMKRIANLYL